MTLSYDIPKYITKIRMSSKIIILVEGKNDQIHLTNLIQKMKIKTQPRIESAEIIKGDCALTAKNNRQKILKINEAVKNDPLIKNIILFCDREFDDFSIDDEIKDLKQHDYWIGRLTKTDGHSFENYFFDENFIVDAFSYLCASPNKVAAFDIFKKTINSSYKNIAAMSLAARELAISGYPIGKIHWSDLVIYDDHIEFDIENWKSKNSEYIDLKFVEHYLHFIEITNKSCHNVCSKIMRGHTGVILLQRVFAACIFKANNDDVDDARKQAQAFCLLKENTLTTALAEAWSKKAIDGQANRPDLVLKEIA